METMTMLANMSPRERTAAIGGGALAILILLWATVADPIAKGRVALAQKIESKKREIVEVRELSGKLLAVKGRFGALERRMAERGGPSLLSVVESAANAARVKERAASMEPQPPAEVEGYMESSVALKMDKIGLGGLVDFLKEVAAQKTFIRVKRISVKPLFENPDLLDVSLTLCWYERK